MKVALVHDHLAQDGGAEKVLKVFADMFPEAPIYTLLCDKKNAEKYYKGRKIETSIIQKLPGGIKHYQWYMPFMPMAVEFFDLGSYDLVISDASAFAKGVITRADCLHICYCHTPTRYIWSDTHQYISELKYNKYLKKIISLVLNYIRLWDRQAADRVDKFIANSRTVKRRIKKYYRRDSIVIYPPVEVDKFYISKEIGDYYLIGCRLAPYKRVDIVIEAFKKLESIPNPPLNPLPRGDFSALPALPRGDFPGEGNYKLKIFGDGIDLPRLQKIAGNADNIEFLGRVAEEEKAELYSRAQAFLHPQEEDFGITPVESMASGRPVIAFGKGGATETVIEGKTGIFFNSQTPEAIMAAVKSFNNYNWNPQAIREQAKQFSEENFRKKIKEFIEEEWKKFLVNSK